MKLSIGAKWLFCLCLLCLMILLSSCNASSTLGAASDQSETQDGTASTSEIDWTELQFFKENGIPLEPDKTDLPSYTVLSTIVRGMTKEEVFSLVGNPQRVEVRKMSPSPATSIAAESICYVYDSSDGVSVYVLWGHMGSSESDLVVLNTCPDSNSSADEEAYVHKNRLTEEEQSLLKDQTKYDYLDNALKGFVYSEQPVLPISDQLIFRFGPFLECDDSQRPLYTERNEIFRKNVSSFLVFDDTMVIMQRTDPEEDQIRIGRAAVSAAWIRDLIGLRGTITILGAPCQIIDLYCSYVKDLDGRTSVVLYFDTSQGGYVHYYDHAQAENAGEWFNEQTFVEYVQQYNQYLLDNAYNENGEPLYGQMPFWEYLDVIRAKEE